ncbi:MAG: DUF3862 domain-containing protein [Coriobacteriales bacterium]|nr:DUF3862 domain-containing protein [Coriobacteriales bacterium]
MGVATFSDGRTVEYDQAVGVFLVEGERVDMSTLTSAEAAGSLTWTDDATREWAYSYFAPPEGATAAVEPSVEPSTSPTEPIPVGEPVPAAEPPKRALPIWALVLIIVLAVLLLCSCVTIFGLAIQLGKSKDSGGGAAKPRPPVTAPQPPITEPAPEPAPAPGTEPAPSDEGPATVEKYDKIENGMSYDEVVEIMGSKGEELSSSEFGGVKVAVFLWYGSDRTSNMMITFQDDKVMSKAQYGLE